MTAAAYTTDLTDITTAETTTGWAALGGGASGLAVNADSSMQGTAGVGKPVSAAEKGQVFGSGGTTIAAGRHVYLWIFLTTPGLAAALASRGLTAVIGSATNAYCQYHVEGNDTYGAAGRVGKCYPINPAVYTSNPGSSPYRTLSGSPSGTYAQFGAVANITSTIKGENLVVDAIRHGTGVFITGGTTPDPDATFAGLALRNDYNDATNGYNRWGVFTGVGGGYELQGKCYIGRNNSGTATQCRFTDSNKTITIPENPHVTSTFNEFYLDHASSVITLTNITIQSLGATSPGLFTVDANNPTVVMSGCNLAGLSTVTLRSNTSLENCILRACTAATVVNSATITGSTFNKYTSTVTLTCTPAMLANITGNSFISDGGNHAVDLGTGVTTQTVSWNNTLTGYASSDGSTGNEAIRVDVAAGNTLTINVATGATTPSVYKTGTGTVNVVAGLVTTTITVLDVINGDPLTNARVFLYAANGTGDMPYLDSITIANSGTTATVTHTAHGMQTNDKVWIKGASHAANNGVFTITVSDANTYTYTMASTPGSSPTGTITSTWVAVYATTNTSGQVTMSRSFNNSQPITGWARKATP